MKALASRHHNLRGVLDPNTVVHAGVFKATAYEMLHDGWVFEMLQHAYESYNSHESILAKNPRNGMVGQCYLPHRYREARVFEHYLYFSPDLVLSMEMYRRIEMPRMEMSVMDIGHPSAYNMPHQCEMQIYEANSREGHEPKELIIMPEDIPELMDKIIKLQEPRAKEILADDKNRKGLSELQTEAKILSFSA